MYQRPLVRAELLDSWTWDLIKRIVESLPSSVLESIDSTMSHKPRFSLSSVLDTSLRQESSEVKKPAASALRPVHSRLQTPSLVAGRVAVRPEVGAAKGVVQHQRLDPMNICIVGTRRAGGGDLGRVMLDVNTNASTLEYSLYPGQPVVLKATNVNGRSLNAFEFFQVSYLFQFSAFETKPFYLLVIYKSSTRMLLTEIVLFQPKIPPLFNLKDEICPGGFYFIYRAIVLSLSHFILFLQTRPPYRGCLWPFYYEHLS